MVVSDNHRAAKSPDAIFNAEAEEEPTGAELVIDLDRSGGTTTSANIREMLEINKKPDMLKYAEQISTTGFSRSSHTCGLPRSDRMRHR